MKRPLLKDQIQQYIFRLTIPCPECGHKLPVNDSDGYVFCSFCKVSWDLTLGRTSFVNQKNDVRSVVTVKPNGSHIVRDVPVVGQLTIFDGVE